MRIMKQLSCKIMSLAKYPNRSMCHPVFIRTCLALGLASASLLGINAEAQEASPRSFQERVATIATREWREFVGNMAVVRTKQDVDKLALRPAEYDGCLTINRYWNEGVGEAYPISNGRLKNTCTWPKVAYYCKINGLSLPNYKPCNRKQKDAVWDFAPWSAAFVSYVFKQSGAGSSFQYAPAHSKYIIESIRNTKGRQTLTPRLFGYSIADVSPSIGDLICAPRGENHGLQYNDIPLGREASFESHCDIVVSVGTNIVEAIGGNVGDTVAKTIVSTDQNGRIINDQPEFRNWIVVIKNRIGENGLVVTPE